MGNNWRILISKSQLSPYTIFWMLGDQVVWLPLDVPEECWWGQVHKLPTRWEIAHRYAIFLCSLDVQISNDNLVRQLTRYEASELENHGPSQQIVFLWCQESFHPLDAEVKKRFVNVPFGNSVRLSQRFVTLGRGTIAHSHVCWTNSFLFLFDILFFVFLFFIFLILMPFMLGLLYILPR